MSPKLNWIQAELKRIYPRANLKVGVDLNRNGRLEKNEKIATFNKNAIHGNNRKVVGDWADWLAFYQHNVARLKKLGGVFALSSRFKGTNPIHAIMTIESRISTPAMVKKTYKVLLDVYLKMKAKNRASLTPAERLLDLYQIIRDQKMSIGLKWGDDSATLLTEGVHNKKLDCDTTSFIIATVSHELGWSVYLVNAPNHAFIRWDNGKSGRKRVRFNLDMSGSFKDRFYQKYFNIPSLAISQGVYLRNLTKKQIVALIFYNCGNRKRRLKKYHAAIRDFSKAAKLDPKLVGAWHNRAVVKEHLKRYRKAIKDFDKAIKLNFKHADSYHGRGNSWLALKKYRAAIRDYSKAIGYNPKHWKAYLNRGFVKQRLGKQREAIKDYSKAIRLNRKSAEAYFYRGVAKAALGKLRKAIRDYDKVIELVPKNVSAHYNRALLKGRLGKHREAIKGFDTVIRLNLKSAGVYNNRGFSKFHLGRYREAIKDYDTAIRLNPGFVIAYANRALAYEKLKKYGVALKDFDRAIKLAPAFGKYYIHRGRLKKKLGKIHEGNADIKKGRKLLSKP